MCTFNIPVKGCNEIKAPGCNKGTFPVTTTSTNIAPVESNPRDSWIKSTVSPEKIFDLIIK